MKNLTKYLWLVPLFVLIQILILNNVIYKLY